MSSVNISYDVVLKKTIEEDFDCVAKNKIKAQTVGVYCQSLDMCVSLYTHIVQALQDASYYPPGAEHISNSRLFAMFHSCTLVLRSQTNSVVRVVFATMALGMGVDFKSSLDYIIHYSAPHTLEDYIQESGRAGRDNQQAVSRIYWKPSEAPVYAEQCSL